MTKLKKILICLIPFALMSLINDSDTNNSRPFDSIDFSRDDWLLTFTENIHDTSINNFGDISQKIKLINDSEILDSLKSNFICDLDKQIDGPHEFVITLYKNNRFSKQFVFDNQENFDFGELNDHFIEIKKSKDLTLTGTENLNKTKQNLNNKNIDFYYSSEFEHLYGSLKKNGSSLDNLVVKNNFTYNLEISFSNLHRIGIDQQGAFRELFEIYPELNNDTLIFSFDGNTRQNDYRLYKFSFPCPENFSLDIERFKKSNNVFFYNLIGVKPTEYYLTQLIK
jgi:hypothetical protein